MPERRTGKQIVLDHFAAEGVRHVFGNPGTTELPLIDAIEQQDGIDYVLCLQEAAAVSMADAYAHASGEVGVANLHVGPGLGNAIGSLYNALEGDTPVVVTAGQQDTRLRLREPLLSHDLVAMAAPVTKWSVEAQSAAELPLLLHRAFKTAREAPSGPVFVSLPMDVLDQQTDQPLVPPSRLYARAEPDVNGIAEATRLLLRAEQPFIVCGDRVGSGDAVQELVALAELLGAPVWSEVLPARINFPLQHDHYGQRMPHDHAAIRQVLDGADLVLLVGGDFFEEVWFAEGSPFPPGAKVLHIDPSPARVARFQRSDCGIVADIGSSLRALCQVLSRRAGAAWRQAAEARCAALAATRNAQRETAATRLAEEGDRVPMSPARLMHEIAGALPAGCAVVAEAITAGADMFRALSCEEPGDLLSSRGGGIGQGIPGGVGFKLAQPQRPVLCISGDGSALYNVQALWTAAHYRLPMVFLIIDNGSYRVLKMNLDRYRRGTRGGNRGYAHLDLSGPDINFVALAAGLGVEAERLADPATLPSALERAFSAQAPRLLVVRVDGTHG